MVSPRALSWDHSYSLYIQRPWVVWSVGITSATIWTLMTHRFYLSLSKTDPEMSLSLVQQCLQDVSDWMIANKLKLNPDKTEFILISTKAQRDKIKKYFPTKLLDQDVTPTDSARNLGVEFDKDFNLYIKSLSIMLLSYTWLASLAQMFNSGSDKKMKWIGL